MNEKLSALVDNELSEIEERRVLAELGRDPALRATWDRYHLIRASLRKELEQVAPSGLPTAVAAAIAADPAHQQRRALALGIGKLAGGLAIAATVATIAVLFFPNPLAPTNDSGALAAKSGTATAVAVRNQPKSVAMSPLNAYLVEHNEFAPTAGMGNMLPYVRTVKHDDTR